MTKYKNKTFTVPIGDSEKYRDNWDVVFGLPEREENEQNEEGVPERDNKGEVDEKSND